MTVNNYTISKHPWGWDIEWYDGKGTYIGVDELRWWQILPAFIGLWREVRRHV